MKGTRVSASRASAKDSATTEETTEVKPPREEDDARQEGHGGRG